MKNLLFIIGILFIFSCKKAENIQPMSLQSKDTTFTIEYSEHKLIPLNSVIYYAMDKLPADSIKMTNPTHKMKIYLTNTVGNDLYIWISGRKEHQIRIYNANKYSYLQLNRDPHYIVPNINPCEFRITYLK